MINAQALAAMPPAERERIIRSLSTEQVRRLKYAWRFWARPPQIEPVGDDWIVWLIMAGRAFGKTRAGAEWVIERVNVGAKHIALIGRTFPDVVDTMIQGESGIISLSSPDNMPVHVPSKRRLIWPNGAEAITYTAEKPDQLRGPQPDTIWADELAAWFRPAMWTQVEFALRSIKSGLKARACVTTTPRPTKLVRDLMADPTTVVTRGSTFDNAANVDPAYIAKLRRNFDGTRIGRQELYGAVLDDVPGALWKRDRINALRVIEAPELRVIVIAVDPAVTSGEFANETGILVAGVGIDGHGYVLEDISGKYAPNIWGDKVVEVYSRWSANRVVAEVNQGGDLVATNIQTAARDKDVQIIVRKVHASRGKRTRAEPIAALAEQGRIHHVGEHIELEDQLCSWEPDVVTEDGPQKKIQHSDSPDRLDAYVWAFTDLMIDRNPNAGKQRGSFARRPSIDDVSLG